MDLTRPTSGADDTAPAAPRSARRRPTLAAVAAAVLAVGLLGLAGVFAAATDRAHTQTNRYESAAYEEGPDVDLQLAPRNEDGTCGFFSDDLATRLITVTGDASHFQGNWFDSGLCLRNVGIYWSQVSLRAIDLDDRELDCTSREGEVDQTCIEGEAGELADLVSFHIIECEGSSYGIGNVGLTELAAEPRAVRPVQPGAPPIALCIQTRLLATPAEARLAQSDVVTWRFAFDGVASDGDPTDCTQLGYEPNDTVATATPLALDLQMDGSLCPGDEDWYAFDHSGGDIELVFDSPERNLMELWLTDGAGNRLAEVSSQGEQRSSGRIYIGTHPPGEYHFVATGPADRAISWYMLGVFSS